ncbi:unnamed protein product, partial [Ectocarpus sp. 8 AP-2014]
MTSKTGERQALLFPSTGGGGGGSIGGRHGSTRNSTSHKIKQDSPTITVPSDKYDHLLPVEVPGGSDQHSSSSSSTSFRGEVRPTLDDKASFAVVLGDVLLVDTARGIFFPTLWTHVSQLGGDKIALGYCVGAFSLGRTLMSPIFGRMSTEHGYQRALLISTALVSFGALFYAVADSVFTVFLSQVFLGVGSGTLGVTRGYVADKTTKEQRTYLLAYTTAVQYAGFTVMPILGGFFSYLLGSTEIPLLGRFLLLTQFTAPAFFVAAMSTVLFLLLCFVFQDGNRQKPAKTTSSAKELSGTASGVTLTTDLGSDDSGSLSDDDVPNQEQQDLWPAAEYSPPGSVSSNSGGCTGRGSPPSVVGQYVDISGDGGWGGSDDKGMEDVEDGYQTGLAAAAAGAAAAGNRAGVQATFHDSVPDEAKHGDVVGRETSTLGEGGWLARKLRLRLPSRGDMLIYGGFLLNVSTKGTISCFETIGAAYAIATFSLTSAEAGSMFATCGAIGVVALLSMRLLCKHFNDIQLVLGGMSFMTVTCAMLALPPTFIGLNVFIAAVFLMYSVGYPIGHTAVLGLFSKVVGAQPQGALMGWFGSAGALARTCFPVLAGEL